ncbi:MAG: glycosyltransferase family 4 protein [Steroidobacteraceae bacterium]
MTTPLPIKIVALGLRGIPQIPGGIETHAAELYPRLVQLGAQVTVVGRTRYRPAGVDGSWRGVGLKWLPSPRRRGFEAGVHALIGVLYAGICRPDVVHIHAVGPSIMTPLAKLLGLRVVVTHHGEDYLREKWNAPERTALRIGERFAAQFADSLIVISSSLQRLIQSRFGREATFIPNGVTHPNGITGDRLVRKYGLTPRRYVIQVSRLVPEKRQLDLISAFAAAKLPDWKLLLVGGSQGETPYAASIRQAAAGNETIVCTGPLAASDVYELLSDAGIFVLPSSHEGLPIALLEAIGLGVPSLASDIPGNREIGLDAQSYFTVGDTNTLAAKLRDLASAPDARRAAAVRYAEICSRYDWTEIARATLALMQSTARRQTVTSLPSAQDASTVQ